MESRVIIIVVLAMTLAGCTNTTPRGQIVFQSNRDGNFEIYSMNDNGANLRRLTHSDTYDVTPSWSPDGSHVLFASDRDGMWDIYTMNSDGGNVTRLTSDAGANYSPSWSADGRRIVFVSTRDAANGEIYLMHADGNAVERLTRDSTFKDFPSLTPDGSVILYIAAGRTARSLVSLDLASRSVSTLTPAALDPGRPRCSPDGRTVLFAGASEGHSAVYALARTGGLPNRLTTGEGVYQTPGWIGDGNSIIYSKNGGLYMLSLDTHKETMLSNKGDSYPDWRSE